MVEMVRYERTLLPLYELCFSGLASGSQLEITTIHFPPCAKPLQKNVVMLSEAKLLP